MNKLWKKTLVGLIQFQVVLALLLFVPAGSICYWEGWVYWLVFGGCATVITVYLLKHDPDLVRRRLHIGPGAETEPLQKFIQAAAGVASCTLWIVPGIDHRLHWSSVPTLAVVAADGVVVLGYWIVFIVMRENSYAAATIQVEDNQKVIQTGPYSMVRHPMYLGALIMFLGTPPALGSLYGLYCVAPLLFILVARLLSEERYLRRNLPGYREYCRKVRYHLIPFVW